MWVVSMLLIRVKFRLLKVESKEAADEVEIEAAEGGKYGGC